MKGKLLYSKKDVAQALGCSISKIDKLMAQGEIQYFKYGKAKQSGVRFATAHIDDYLKKTIVNV